MGGDLNRQRMNKRIAQMQFLLDNFDKPVITPGGFNEMEVLEDGYCPSGITMAIINFMSHAKEFNYTTIASFMAKIQSYLPKKLRISTAVCQRKGRRESPLWNTRNINVTRQDEIGEETKEYLDQMIEWLNCMKSKCLNDLTFSYLTQGKNQFIEIMKRRWKDEYSEKVEQTVAANVSSDNTVNLIIDDA